MNKDYDDFRNALAFLDKLRNMQDQRRDSWPLSVIYRDEFENLEKFVRRGYYGK